MEEKSQRREREPEKHGVRRQRERGGGDEIGGRNQRRR